MPRWKPALTFILLLSVLLPLAGCTPPTGGNAFTITIIADGTSQVMIIRDETTVSDVLRRAGIS